MRRQAILSQWFGAILTRGIPQIYLPRRTFDGYRLGLEANKMQDGRILAAKVPLDSTICRSIIKLYEHGRRKAAPTGRFLLRTPRRLC